MNVKYIRFSTVTVRPRASSFSMKSSSEILYHSSPFVWVPRQLRSPCTDCKETMTTLDINEGKQGRHLEGARHLPSRFLEKRKKCKKEKEAEERG